MRLGASVLGSEQQKVGGNPWASDPQSRPLTTAPQEGTLADSILPEQGSQPTSVYKYYDAHKILIYVGMTSGGITRNRQHNADKAWWPCVAEQDVEHFDDRDAAHLREVELIQSFRPPFNIQHNPEHADIRRAYIALASDPADHLTVKQHSQAQIKCVKLSPVYRDGHLWLVTHPNNEHIFGAVAAWKINIFYGGVGVGSTSTPERAGAMFRIPVVRKRDRRIDQVNSAVAHLNYASLKTPVVMKIKSITLR